MQEVRQGSVGDRAPEEGQSTSNEVTLDDKLESVVRANEQLRDGLAQNGFKKIGNTELGGEKTEILFRQQDGVAVMLIDSVVIPDRHPVGGASIVGLGEKSHFSIFLCSPNEQMLKSLATVSKIQGDEAEAVLDTVLDTLALNYRVEVLQHEMQHIADYQQGAPWGKVAVYEQTKGGQTPASIQYEQLGKAPSEIESNAATLVLEMKAHLHNGSSEPTRARAAIGAVAKIEQFVAVEDQAAIEQALGDFAMVLTKGGAYAGTNNAEVIEQAAEWIIENAGL